MSNRTLIISLIVVVVAALVLWGGIWAYQTSQSENSTDATANNALTNTDSSPTNSSTAMSDCTRNFDEQKLKDKISLKDQFVTIDFKEYGQVKLQLFDKDAPKTVENFLRLTHAGFYDCLTVHRVAQGFVIQTGDPNGTGTGGRTAFDAPTFNDELNPNTPSFKTGYVKGVLAMANRGPNTNSSQFFITLADLNSSLPKNYTIFGKVVSGMEVVEKIGQVEINPGPFGDTDGTPKVPIVIEKAAISSQ